MRVWPGHPRSSVAAVLAILVALSFGGACADEGTGRSPFGVLKREGLIGVVPPGTAEHEALFSRPIESTTDEWGTAAQSSTPADDVVFATPALPGSQETVTGPAATLLPSPLVAASADAVVFGPPQGGADPGSMSDRPASASSSPESQSVAAALPTLAPEDAARLKARARGLLANGSVASARALLEQAASRGDAEGEYLLAQTYDPEALTRSGMIGVAGDAARAEALYRAAQLGGYRTPDKNARAAQP